MPPQKQDDEYQGIIERVLSRETPLEKWERGFRCPHAGPRTLCLKCAGLDDNEIKRWRKYRTRGRFVTRGLLSYVPVTISRADCILASRQQGAVSLSKVSDWYKCRKCGRTTEVENGKQRPESCPQCSGSLISVPEPFQTCEFSPEAGIAAKASDYAGAGPAERPASSETLAIALELFLDPNSRVQEGGVGYLRVPLSAPRATRADAPQWIDIRENFLGTLKSSRAVRGDEILRRFYLEDETDTQIAKAVAWTKDAVKKERGTLIRQGNEFFRQRSAKYPPSPAVSERGTSHHRVNHPPTEEAFPVSPTPFVALCLPELGVLRLYPVFESDGERYAKKDGSYVPLSRLHGFLREEHRVPRNRVEVKQVAAD